MIDSNTKRLFIFAGEQSGDLHGSHLVQALRVKLPNLLIEGVPGPKMRQHNVASILRMEDFEVMGFTDVICALPRLYKHFYKIRDYILSSKPEGVVLIDYPGFNLRMAKALRKQGYKGKIIQYVSPTVWAWGKHRINEMATTLDLLLTIYPFESKCYEATLLNVTYVGNPLCEYLKNYHYKNTWQTVLDLPPSTNLIAIFPGSRQGEITRNLPILLEAASLMLQDNPQLVFGISCANNYVKDFLKNNPSKLPIHFIPKEYTYELMRDCHSALAKSGTVTLELALHQRPTVVIYKLTTLNRFYAKYILKLRLLNYCIVNILAKKTIFPELIASGLTPSNIAQHFKIINEEGSTRTTCMQACQEVAQSLENNHMRSSTLAANAIASLLTC